MTAILPSSFLGTIFLRCCPSCDELSCSDSFVCRESRSEHGTLAYRLFFRRFILDDVPMLGEKSVLNAHDICSNPIHREAKVRKSPVHDDEVSLGHDGSRFVLQRWRKALDEIEQTFA